MNTHNNFPRTLDEYHERRMLQEEAELASQNYRFSIGDKAFICWIFIVLLLFGGIKILFSFVHLFICLLPLCTRIK